MQLIIKKIIDTLTPQFIVSYLFFDISEICTDGWKHFRGSCYQIFAKDFVLPGVNYARAMCRFHSADLVTIRSQAEQDFVHKLFEPVS